MAGMGDIRIKDEEAIKTTLKKAVSSGDAEKASGVKLTKPQKKGVMKNLNSDKGMEKATAKAEGKKASVSDNFTSALLHFVPLIAGTVIGGAEAGISAQEGTNKALESQRTAGLEERKVAATEAQQERLNKEGGLSEFQSKSLSLRERQMDQQDKEIERRAKGHELRLEQFGLTKDQTAQLSEQQTKSFGDIEAVTRGLERMLELKQVVNTGPAAGRGQSALELVGQASPEFTELKAESEANVAAYIKAISGAQASDLEVQRLKRVAPTINDDDATYDSKAAAYGRIIERSKAALGQAIATGQPLKKGTIDNILDEEVGKEAGQEETPRQKFERLKAKHGRQ